MMVCMSTECLGIRAGCTLQYRICIEVNLAWSNWHHLTGFQSDTTPHHHGNMHTDGWEIQIESEPDIQRLLLQFSGKESGWTHTRTDKWTNTHTSLSSFWAVFQCAIFSAERPQRYRLWQHARYHRVITDGHTHSNLHVGSWLCGEN